MIVFLRCVAEAIAEAGFRGLIDLVPGGGYIHDVAKAAHEKYRGRRNANQAREDIQALATSSDAEAMAAAVEAVGTAGGEAADDRTQIIHYLAGIPAAARRSLAREDDPSGTTVPESFRLDTPDDVLKFLPPRPPRFRPGDPLPGRSGWVLERLVGIGGFSEVWLARNTGSPGECGAVKFGTDPISPRRMTEYELGVVRRVMDAGRHPNIVPLLDSNLDGGVPWLMYGTSRAATCPITSANGRPCPQQTGWRGRRPCWRNWRPRSVTSTGSTPPSSTAT